MRLCTFDSCDRKHKAKGLCYMHYQRMVCGTLDSPRYQASRPAPGQPTEWPFEFEKRGEDWFRRPSGSDEPWDPVPGFLRGAA